MLKGVIQRLKGRPTLQEEMTSEKLRKVYQNAGRTIGLYSYGCFDMARFAEGTSIGRYCSFSPTCRTQTRNHGMSFLGLNPYFYEPALGVVAENNIPFNAIDISDDVWIGANAVILPSVGTIGRGAAIGAGAIVTKPVPPYAIVAGNPARIIRMRFDEDVINRIEKTGWWKLNIGDLARLIKEHPDLALDPKTHFSHANKAL